MFSLRKKKEKMVDSSSDKPKALLLNPSFLLLPQEEQKNRRTEESRIWSKQRVILLAIALVFLVTAAVLTVRILLMPTHFLDSIEESSV